MPICDKSHSPKWALCRLSTPLSYRYAGASETACEKKFNHAQFRNLEFSFKLKFSSLASSDILVLKFILVIVFI
jgi:hypothetical protein